MWCAKINSYGKNCNFLAANFEKQRDLGNGLSKAVTFVTEFALVYKCVRLNLNIDDCIPAEYIRRDS